MNFTVMTLFPEMIENYMNASITGRALKKGVIRLNAVNIRDYTLNKNLRVDDYIYGGGSGMLMQAEPVIRCYEDIKKKYTGAKPRVLYMSPQGRRFDQEMAKALSHNEDIVFLCGHYEGIDERAIEMINPTEVSLGDFVLTGGEIAAMTIMDAVTRLLPGALGSDDSAIFESFYDGLLEYPQYSRPENFRDHHVPEILLSGNTRLINQWRLEKALERTKVKRPDLYEAYIAKHPEILNPPVKKKRRKKK